MAVKQTEEALSFLSWQFGAKRVGKIRRTLSNQVNQVNNPQILQTFIYMPSMLGGQSIYLKLLKQQFIKLLWGLSYLARLGCQS